MSSHQQRSAARAEEGPLTQVRDDEVRLATGLGRWSLGKSLRRRHQQDGNREKHEGANQ